MSICLDSWRSTIGLLEHVSRLYFWLMVPTLALLGFNSWRKEIRFRVAKDYVVGAYRVQRAFNLFPYTPEVEEREGEKGLTDNVTRALFIRPEQYYSEEWQRRLKQIYDEIQKWEEASIAAQLLFGTDAIQRQTYAVGQCYSELDSAVSEASVALQQMDRSTNKNLSKLFGRDFNETGGHEEFQAKVENIVIEIRKEFLRYME